MVLVDDNDVVEGNNLPTCQIRGEDVIVLLGAGASVDAGLLISRDMTRWLDVKIFSKEHGDNKKWRRYEQLYKAVKSSILYGYHLTAASAADSKTEINIEELVNVLTELAKAEFHPIYPFIAAWNMELVKHGGADFSNLKDFRCDIVRELVGSWVNVKNNESCEYYRGLYRYWTETRQNLRVFSLNYDMCVERACGMEHVCRGFRASTGADGKCRKIWKDGQMDDSTALAHAILLYKLHGSLDWRRDKETRELYCEDSPDPCFDIDDYQLIFGTSYKLSYQDPFLYQISELRKHALKARLIVVIGYGFNDDHINEILGRAIIQKDDAKLYVVDSLGPEEKEKWSARKDVIAKRLKLSIEKKEQITVDGNGAKSFLEKRFSRDFVEECLGEKNEEPF